jgi:maleylacetoacetate isomerase
VRISLNIKNIEHEIVPVNLLEKQHQKVDYLQKQPQGLVPCLETDDGEFLSQSGAILHYVEALYPLTKLIPNDPLLAAKIQSFVDIIACDIHPICNLRILNYLTGTLHASDTQKKLWYQHWIHQGFSALESMLKDCRYSFGEQVTLADLYLIPQVYNALRFNCDMTDFPKIMEIYQKCNQLEAFIQAKPENQIDAI